MILEGICARWANQIIDQVDDMGDESTGMTALGISKTRAEELWEQMDEKLDGIREMAKMFSAG